MLNPYLYLPVMEDLVGRWRSLENKAALNPQSEDSDRL